MDILENIKIVENGLVPIFQSQDKKNLIDARSLHEGLGVKRQFVDWIKDQVESLELEQDKDFTTISQKGETEKSGILGMRQKIDYILTIDTAKHIALASRTKKGKQIRQYFINFEDKAKGFIENELKVLKAQNEILETKLEKYNLLLTHDQNSSLKSLRAQSDMVALILSLRKTKSIIDNFGEDLERQIKETELLAGC